MFKLFSVKSNWLGYDPDPILPKVLSLSVSLISRKLCFQKVQPLVIYFGFWKRPAIIQSNNSLNAESWMRNGRQDFLLFFFGNQGIRVLSFPAVRGECNAFPLCSFLHSHFTENRQTHKSLGFVFRAGNTRKYANKIP